jgi:hypothetical protein
MPYRSGRFQWWRKITCPEYKHQRRLYEEEYVKPLCPRFSVGTNGSRRSTTRSIFLSSIGAITIFARSSSRGCRAGSSMRRRHRAEHRLLPCGRVRGRHRPRPSDAEPGGSAGRPGRIGLASTGTLRSMWPRRASPWRRSGPDGDDHAEGACYYGGSSALSRMKAASWACTSRIAISICSFSAPVGASGISRS